MPALVHTQPPDPSGGDLPEPARPAQALIVALNERQRAENVGTDLELMRQYHDALRVLDMAEAELDRHWMCLDQKETKEKQAK